MKILAVTDIHGSKEALKRVKEKSKDSDIVIISGDITVFSIDLIKILHKINSWKKKVLIIPGNHEVPEELRKESKKFENIIYLNKRAYEIDNYFFLGIEGSGFSQIDESFDKTSKKFIPIIQKKRNLFKKYNVGFHYILMTHAPPYKTKCDMISGRSHCGNKTIRKFIRRTQPELAICGHIHECFNTEDSIGKTTVVNPGIYGKMFKI